MYLSLALLNISLGPAINISLKPGYYDSRLLSSALETQGVKVRIEGAGGSIFALALTNRPIDEFLNRFASTCDLKIEYLVKSNEYFLQRPQGYAENRASEAQSLRRLLLGKILGDIDNEESLVQALEQLDKPARENRLSDLRKSQIQVEASAAALMDNDEDRAAVALASDGLRDARRNPFDEVEETTFDQLIGLPFMLSSTLRRSFIAPRSHSQKNNDLTSVEVLSRLFWEPRSSRLVSSYGFVPHAGFKVHPVFPSQEIVPDISRPSIAWRPLLSKAEQASLDDRANRTNEALRSGELHELIEENPLIQIPDKQYASFQIPDHNPVRVSEAILRWAAETRHNVIYQVSESYETLRPTTSKEPPDFLTSLRYSTASEPTSTESFTLNPGQGFTFACSDGYLECKDFLSFLDSDVTEPEAIALALDICDQDRRTPSLKTYILTAKASDPHPSNKKGLPDSLVHRPGFVSSIPFLMVLDRAEGLAAQVDVLQPGQTLTVKVDDLSAAVVDVFCDALRFAALQGIPTVFTLDRVSVWSSLLGERLPLCQLRFTRPSMRPGVLEMTLGSGDKGQHPIIDGALGIWRAQLKVWDQQNR